MKATFQTPYTTDLKWSDQFATENKLPSLTQQSDAMETDINLIVKRFTQTGQLPQVQTPALYQDFSGITDFHDAMLRVREAEEQFLLVPAELRAQLDNDPMKFVEFATDPKNRETMEKFGLTAPHMEKDATLREVIQTLRGEDNGEDEPSRSGGLERRPGGQDAPRTPSGPNDAGRGQNSTQGPDGRRGVRSGPDGPPPGGQDRSTQK